MKKPNLNMKRASLLTSSLLCSALLIAVPLRKELNEGWQFKQARLSNWYPATVPGVVHTDLINNKIIEDPFFRLNERGMQWIDKEDWIYQTSFQLTPEIMERQNIDLVFKGLDTYADVYLNEKKILETNNMFREWKTDIKAELKPGENILKSISILPSRWTSPNGMHCPTITKPVTTSPKTVGYSTRKSAYLPAKPVIITAGTGDLA